jgi:hypothetical protein
MATLVLVRLSRPYPFSECRRSTGRDVCHTCVEQCKALQEPQGGPYDTRAVGVGGCGREPRPSSCRSGGNSWGVSINAAAPTTRIQGTSFVALVAPTVPRGPLYRLRHGCATSYSVLFHRPVCRSLFRRKGHFGATSRRNHRGPGLFLDCPDEVRIQPFVAPHHAGIGMTY